MAAGLVSHNITTASGVTFSVISWVPDTGLPDVGAVPVHIITDGTLVAGIGAGNATAAQRVTLASNDPSITQWTAGTLTSAARTAAAAVILTRTADANPYVANKVIGAAPGSTAALSFANVGPSGAEVTINTVELEIDDTGLITGETSYRLYLYNVTPPSALGDNAAWDLPSGDRASFLGYVDLNVPIDLGSTLYVRTDNVGAQFTLSGTGLFGYLVTNSAYTPSASRVYKIKLHTVY